MLKWFFPNFWFAAFMGLAFIGYVSSHQQNELIAELEHLNKDMIPANSCPTTQSLPFVAKISRLPSSIQTVAVSKEKELLSELSELHKMVSEQNSMIISLKQNQSITPNFSSLEKPVEPVKADSNLKATSDVLNETLVKLNEDTEKTYKNSLDKSNSLSSNEEGEFSNCYTEEKNCIMENEDDFRNTNNMVFCRTRSENCPNNRIHKKEEAEDLM